MRSKILNVIAIGIVFLSIFTVSTTWLSDNFKTQQLNLVETLNYNIPNRSATVIVYGVEWCIFCKKLKKYLALKRVKYTYIDVESNDDGHIVFKRLKGDSYPLIIIENKLIRGFNEIAIESELSKANLI